MTILDEMELQAAEEIKPGNFGAHEVVKEEDDDEEFDLIQFTSKAYSLPTDMMEWREFREPFHREL